MLQAEPAGGSGEQSAAGVIGLLVAVGEPDADGLQSAMLIATRALFAAWPALDRHWQALSIRLRSNRVRLRSSARETVLAAKTTQVSQDESLRIGNQAN